MTQVLECSWGRAEGTNPPIRLPNASYVSILECTICEGFINLRVNVPINDCNFFLSNEMAVPNKMRWAIVYLTRGGGFDDGTNNHLSVLFSRN